MFAAIATNKTKYKKQFNKAGRQTQNKQTNKHIAKIKAK